MNSQTTPEQWKQVVAEFCNGAKPIKDDPTSYPTKSLKDMAEEIVKLRRELTHSLKYLDSLGEMDAGEPEYQMRESFRRALR